MFTKSLALLFEILIGKVSSFAWIVEFPIPYHGVIIATTGQHESMTYQFAIESVLTGVH